MSAASLDAQIAEHEACFLRPQRAELGALRKRLGWRAGMTGRELWDRAAERGVISAELRADPRRNVPTTAEAALLLASDPEGVRASEDLAREVVRRLEAWGASRCERVAWRLVSDAEGSWGRGAYDVPGVLYKLLWPKQRPEHGDPRFWPVLEWVCHAHAWSGRPQLEVPAQLSAGFGRTVELPQLAGRKLADIPDPFAPYLELVRHGYVIAGLDEGVIHLALPAPARRRASLREGDSRSRAHLRPRAVWRGRTSALRMAAVRGDLGALRGGLPLLPRVPELGEPPLTSFAVYGGVEALALLAEHGWLELDARDGREATPLMYAASMRKDGPLGANEAEMGAPCSVLTGAASCTYLAQAGAQLEAVDARGWTALHWAVAYGREPCVRALLEAGAHVDAQDSLGRTPLMLALSALERPTQPAQYMSALGVHEAETPPVVDALLGAKADVDVRDRHGWTALHYLANATAGAGQRRLARMLALAGAMPSHDRLGLTPAGICTLHDTPHTDGGPFDARTGVAAGPGPWPTVSPPEGLTQRLIAWMYRLPPIARSPPPRTRAQLEDWSVWADWLESVGDPRGELVQASLACVGLGGSERRVRLERRDRAEQRAAAWIERAEHRVLWPRPVRTRRPRAWREHGFVHLADLARADLRTDEQLACVRNLVAFEPLLVELRLGRDTLTWERDFDWSELCAGLAELGPLASVRRLVLMGLPPELPDLSRLREVFPELVSLVLYPDVRFEDGELSWPGLRHLRIQHRTCHQNEMQTLRLGLRVDAPALTHLELGLRRRSVAVRPQLGSDSARIAVGFIGRFPSLTHLRLAPGALDLVSELLASDVMTRLRGLEICEAPPQLIHMLAAQPGRLRELEAFGLVARDEGDAQWYVDELHALPQLHVARCTRR